MPVGNRTLIDLREFVDAQSKERFRTFVLHDRPLSGKSNFARKLAETIPGGVYLDLLQHFVDHRALAEKVDRLNAASLSSIVVGHAATVSATLLLVDEMDFLLHIWSGDLREFKHEVASLSRENTKTVIGFVLQTTPSVEEWELRNTAGRSRVLTLEDIQAL